MLRTLAFASALTVAGCGGPRFASQPAPLDRNRLTYDEILNSNARQGDLYDAIRSLRPWFFAAPSATSRGSMVSMPLAVHFGKLRQGGVETLRSISALSVEEVRYLDPTASLNEFGPRESGGAIIVVLRDPSKNPDGTFSERAVARATVP